MEDLLHHGWVSNGARSYVHYCGTKVVQRGKQSWNARQIDGTLSIGHKSAEAAIRWIEAHDPEYWTYGAKCSAGLMVAGIGVTTGFLGIEDENKDMDERDHVVVLSLFEAREFPTRHIASFKRLFLSSARCARCDRQSTEIILRSLPEEGTSRRRRTPYIICCCGYPVWRISCDAFFKAEQGIRRAEYSREIERQRRKNIREAGGRHSILEIQEILSFQENRCIYCNKLFANGVQATKDHLIPVSHGGTKWATNIVMACHRCNSRRGTIPFRTYCKLLSPTQNRRILRCLGRRIGAISPEELPEGVFEAFCEGIARHDPRHRRYRFILGISAVARRYAATNKLLSATPHLIRRRAKEA